MRAFESQTHSDSQPVPSVTRERFSSLALDTVLPMTPAQFAAKMIEDRWGAEPLSAQLVDLIYDFQAYPAHQGVHQGKVRTSQTLVQVLLSNYQTVGAGRFGETAFGLYTPPLVGPQVRVVEVDESLNPGGGYNDYEGIYRRTEPQIYGPGTQLTLQPAEFKKWVWELEFKDTFTAYLNRSWPSDEAIVARHAYPLRSAVKAAFVMAAYLQHQENSLTQDGLGMALLVAGLDARQSWEQLTVEQLQAFAMNEPALEATRLGIYRYVSTDIWCFRRKTSERTLLYVPGNASPFHEFSDHRALCQWVVNVARDPVKKQALAAHFIEVDRQDGTFHSGVLSALDGMAIYPRQHPMNKGHGFFNNEGYWDPADYIHFNPPLLPTDPFAQWVLVMKQAAQASIETIRDDAQVNRDDLSAVVEPVVEWINRFGPLALFVPGGEGLLALAGLIDAGYGLAQAVDGMTPEERSAGVTRTVFGLLNALPLVAAGAAIKTEEHAAATTVLREPGHVPVVNDEHVPDDPESTPSPQGGTVSSHLPDEHVRLLRGIGPSVDSFSDEVLVQIGRVSGADDDLLHMLQAGRRPPTPMLADTISRFALDQELQRGIAPLREGLPEAEKARSSRVEVFNARYDALQQSDHEIVKLFRHEYPGLPKSAIEQMLDRSGVDLTAPRTLAETRRVMKQLSGKAQQYEQHVRLSRAYEGLYLRSVENTDSDILALHTLERLPGWPRDMRIEVIDGVADARVLDRIGPGATRTYRQLIKRGRRYQARSPQVDTVDFETALLDILPVEQRSALGLRPHDELEDLRLKIRENALPRAELLLGLHRMDSGLAFEGMGLRGGGFPVTPQGGELSVEVMKLQVKEIYPTSSTEEVQAFLQHWGDGAQAELGRLRLQLQQLRLDLRTWIEQVEDDIEDMEVPLLVAGEEDAQGLDNAQIEEENDARIEDVMDYERHSRIELSLELENLWQRHSDTTSGVYVEGQWIGFRLDMDFEQLHSLPELSVKLQDVVVLSMPDFNVTQRGTLSGFLECFPNLRELDMEGVDLRTQEPDRSLAGHLPPAIKQLSRLTTLNLKATHLTLTEAAAGELGELTRLQVLDLSNNPLGNPPLVLRMSALRRLNLQGTNIEICPVGIDQRPYLDTLDLRNNRITRIPRAVRMQAVGRDNVLLTGNPLSDEDSLRWVVAHRKQTGINLWIGPETDDFARSDKWLTGLSPEQAELQRSRWAFLVAKAGSDRFFGTLEILTRTADFLVDYVPLQQRVWHMVNEMEASAQLCHALFQDVEWVALDGDDPFASFVRLEDRIITFKAAGL